MAAIVFSYYITFLYMYACCWKKLRVLVYELLHHSTIMFDTSGVRWWCTLVVMSIFLEANNVPEFKRNEAHLANPCMLRSYYSVLTMFM